MGPLIPFVFSNEFGLVMAILIGIAFGFILEQAGFSSTKKLVGLFYGYDFTVLRVFFTAGVTAMVGVLLLGHFGLLDLNLIYVNPTFLRSAIVGGLIMGAGFVIGGFCPGTSVCAASIGKIDAFAFIIGSIIGVFGFTEFYPRFENFYLADAWGPVHIFEKLGISQVMFGFLLTIIAIVAFYITWLIENRVNNREPVIHSKKPYIVGAAIPLFILTSIVIFPGKNEIIQNRIARAKEQKKCAFHEISADKLAYELSENYYKYNVIDVRSPEEFNEFHLPLAINIPFEKILERQWAGIFNQKIRTNVFYANNDTLVKMSCLKAKYVGKSQNMILRETADEFKAMFFELKPPASDASKHTIEEFHYRSNTARKMNHLVESLQNIGRPVQKEIKAVKGGCS